MPHSNAKSSTSKLGFYSALISAIAAAGYGVAQILQVVGLISYPLDARLIYAFSLGIATPYLLAIIALHYSVAEERRLWTHIAIVLAALYTVFVTIMYGVQLATVIPESLHDQTTNVLTVTPHSFFWTLDALGYIYFGLSTFFAAFAFERSRSLKYIRIFFIANGVMVPIISLVYFYPHFSTILLLMGSPWILTATGSLLLLAGFFRKKLILQESEKQVPLN